MAAAAARSGRRPESVQLIAVTKFISEPAIRALVELDVHSLAESRPQHLWEKSAHLADLPIAWHMIGHLQRNKVRRTLPLIRLLHSGDSVALFEAVDQCAGEQGLTVPALIEVKVSGDETKHGFSPDAVEPSLAAIAQCKHVEIRGLMGMASLDGGADAARRDFAALRELRDRLAGRCPESIRLDELSMGMSGDYEIAIEEGATMVRIGSAIFEGVEA
jgi:pyridoxal phosphate enzyme (YggS family)